MRRSPSKSTIKVTADLKSLIGRLPRFRKMDRFAGLAVAAAVKAVGRRKLPPGTGVIVATIAGPLNSTEKFIRQMTRHGPELASAFLFPSTVLNLAAGMISITLGLRGPSATVIGRLDEALQIAAGMIEYGQAPAMLAGYVEEGNSYMGVRGRGACFCLLREKGGKKRG
jgi:3-oxoacyl-[acyl-carrier-protein] synthase II